MAHEATAVVRVDAADAGSALVRRVFEEVMRPSFSVEELPDLATFVAGFADGEQEASLLVEADGAPLAAAVYDVFRPGLPALLSYLAVRPGARGSGAGARLLAASADHWRERGDTLVLGEVHDPRCYAERPDERPAARLRFYDRQGAELLWQPWIQPSLAAGSPRVPGMLLMALLRRPPHDGPVVDVELLRAWIEAYFELAEGAVPGDAPYRALLARLDRWPDGVPVGRMGDYGEVELLTG